MQMNIRTLQSSRALSVGIGMLLLIPLFATDAQAVVSPDGVWTEVISNFILNTETDDESPLTAYRVFEIDETALHDILAKNCTCREDGASQSELAVHASAMADANYGSDVSKFTHE